MKGYIYDGSARERDEILKYIHPTENKEVDYMDISWNIIPEFTGIFRVHEFDNNVYSMYIPHQTAVRFPPGEKT